MRTEEERRLRNTLNCIISELADLVDGLNDPHIAEQYFDAKGDFDYALFKLLKEISANKKKKV